MTKYTDNIKKIIDEGEKRGKRQKRIKSISNFFGHPFILSLAKYAIAPAALIILTYYISQYITKDSVPTSTVKSQKLNTEQKK
jgi:hypothetical protein